VGVSWLSERWHRMYVPFYDRMLAGGLFGHLAQSQPPGTTICVLDLRSYPFFGSARQFRVCQPERVHSPEEFMDYLRSREVVMIAARFDLNLTSQGWQKYQRWLTEHEHRFLAVRNSAWPYSVFRVATETP